MIPAAPLVGAVTTRPPAAFSSVTASANRLTQSSAASGSAVAGRAWRLRNKRPARQDPLAAAAALDALLHDGPDTVQPGVRLRGRPPGRLVPPNDVGDGQP